jgi:hypothetical protein
MNNADRVMITGIVIGILLLLVATAMDGTW